MKKRTKKQVLAILEQTSPAARMVNTRCARLV